MIINSKNKRMFQTCLFVLIAIVVLGIGYASISAINLIINGNATASVDQNNFKVYFVTSNITTGTGTASIDENDNTIAYFDMFGLTKKGDYAIATYVVRNDSNSVNADLSLIVNTNNNEYFKVSEQIEKDFIMPGEETLVTLKVEMIKTPISSIETVNVSARIKAYPTNESNSNPDSMNVYDLYDFRYTGSVEQFIAPVSGTYRLEAWGAQGGDAPENISGNRKMDFVEGGKGGYSVGNVFFKKGQIVYVVVGGKGKELNNSPNGAIAKGGYNGGGAALSGGTTNNQGSGGGATHFAINNNLGELKNYNNNQDDVLLVAGGGGGSYNSLSIYYYSYGGAGGGENGDDAIVYFNTKYRSTALINNGFIYSQGLTIPGGGQYAVLSDDTYLYGSFGKGTDAIINITGSDAGAGGGWYGGSKLLKTCGGGGMAGSGGSGHVNTNYVDGQTISGTNTFISPNFESETGHSGDGYARITLINI